jgi:hypothetical protein
MTRPGERLLASYAVAGPLLLVVLVMVNRIHRRRVHAFLLMHCKVCSIQQVYLYHACACRGRTFR